MPFYVHLGAFPATAISIYNDCGKKKKETHFGHALHVLEYKKKHFSHTLHVLEYFLQDVVSGQEMITHGYRLHFG